MLQKIKIQTKLTTTENIDPAFSPFKMRSNLCSYILQAITISMTMRIDWLKESVSSRS